MTSFGAWGAPGGGFNWNMLTNIGAGMLANAEYSPMQAFGKGYNSAVNNSLDQQKQALLFEEYDRKRRADQQQQQFAASLQNALTNAQQPAPVAGAALQPPPTARAVDLGVGFNAGGPNPAAANAANTMAVNDFRQSQVPQAAQAGTMNVMGLNVTPQQIAQAKMWAAAGDTDKAIGALTAGDPNQTELLKNYQFYRQQGGKLDLMQYQQALRQKTEVNIKNNMPGANDDEALKSYNKKVGEDVFAAAQSQSMKAAEVSGLVKTYMELQQATKDEGQWNQLKVQFGPWARMFGVDVEGMSALQAQDAITNKMAPALRVPGSGNTSDRDIMLFLNSMMQLRNTKEGNALIASTLDAVAQSQIKAGEIAEQWASGEISRKEALSQMRALDPFKEFKSKAKSFGVDVDKLGTVPGAGSPQPNPDNKPYFDLKKGKLIRPTTPTSKTQDSYGAPGWNMGPRTMNYGSGVRG